MRLLKEKKLLLCLVIILLLNIFFKGFQFTGSPNSLSLEEISNIKLFYLQNLFTNLHLSRIIPLLVSTLISIISFLYFYNLSRKLLIGFIISLALIFSPWIFILSRSLNTYILFLLTIIAITAVLYKAKIKFGLIIIFILLFRYFISPTTFLHFGNLFSNIEQFFRLIDFKTLFFIGDFTSSYLRIPKTAFFMYLELIPFFFGLYYLIFLSNIKIKTTILNFLVLGMIWFFITPADLIITYKGLIILYAINLIIGLGFFHIINLSFLHQRFTMLSILFLIFIISNLFYYQELFYSHFDKKNSVEYGYAEERLSSLLNKNSDKINHVFISAESGKLLYYLPLFAKNINQDRISQIQTQWLQAQGKKSCFEEKALCVLQQHELESLSLPKNIKINKISHFNGLNAYFLLSRESFK